MGGERKGGEGYLRARVCGIACEIGIKPPRPACKCMVSIYCPGLLYDRKACMHEKRTRCDGHVGEGGGLCAGPGLGSTVGYGSSGTYTERHAGNDTE